MKYDFAEWKLHFEAPANKCPECGVARPYASFGGEVEEPCKGCGYQETEEDE